MLSFLKNYDKNGVQNYAQENCTTVVCRILSACAASPL